MTLIQFANAFVIAITFARWQRRSEATSTSHTGLILFVVVLKQVFCKSVPRAVAGDHCGVLLRGLKREFVDRGMYIGVPGQLPLTDHCAARLYMLSAAEGGRSKPIMSGFSNLAYIETYTVAARVEFEDPPMVMPGELVDRVELIFQKPVVLREGQQFVIRETRHTVISGIITELLAESGREIRGFNYLPTKRMTVESNVAMVRRKKVEKLKNRRQVEKPPTS